MPIYRVQGPDGKIHRFEGPEGASREEIEAFAEQQFGRLKQKLPAVEPDTGFTGAFKSSVESLKGGLGALAGKVGIMDTAEAEKYVKAQEEKARQVFKPTEEGWTEAPVTKFKELLGGSLPYMAAPLAVGAGAALAPVSAPVAAGLGLGAAGLTSATQFTGSNLQRQMETGKTLEETSLGSAVGAAIPQAALDTISMRMIPGIGRIFGQAGVKITPDVAKKIAEQGTMQTLKAYGAQGLKTAGIEGTTEAGQQFLERLQAGLDIADPEARKEYFESFIGGAVLGGTLAVPGTYFERSRAIGEERDKEQAEALKKRIEERQKQRALQETQEATAEMAKLAPKAKGITVTPEMEEQYQAEVDKVRAEMFDERRIIESQLEPLREQIVKAADDKADIDEDTIKQYEQLRSQLDALRPEAIKQQVKDVDTETKALKAKLTKAEKAEDNETAVQLKMQIAANQQKLELLNLRLDALKETPAAPTYEQLQAKIEDLKKQREKFGGAVGDADKIIAIDKKIKALEAQARPGATSIDQGSLFEADQEGVTSYVPSVGSREVLAKEIATGKAEAAKASKAEQKAIETYVPLPPGTRPAYTVTPTGEKRAYTAEEQEYDQALFDFDAKKEEYETAVKETADKTLKDDKGRITEAGKRVQQALEAMQAAKDVILKRAAVEGEPTEVKNRELTEKEQESLLLAVTDTIDSMRKGEFKGGPNPAFARATLKQNATEAITLLKRYAQNQVNLINNLRQQNGLAPLNKPDEARIKSLIGDHIGQKISKATGWRAKEMKATVETVMKNALEQAGLLTKLEGEVKTGFARKEFRDTKDFIKNITDEYATKPVKTRVKAGEKPSYAEQAKRKKLAGVIEEGLEKGKKAEAQAGLEESRKEEKQAEVAAKGFDAFVQTERKVIKQSLEELRKFVAAAKGDTPPTPAEFASFFNSKIMKGLLQKAGGYAEEARKYLGKSVANKDRPKIKELLEVIDKKQAKVDSLQAKYDFTKNKKVEQELADAKEDLAGEMKALLFYDPKRRVAKAYADIEAVQKEINKYYNQFIDNLMQRIKDADAAELAKQMNPVLVKARKEANAAAAEARAKESAARGAQRALDRLKEQAAERVDIELRKKQLAAEQARAEQQVGEIKVIEREQDEKGKFTKVTEVLPGVKVVKPVPVLSRINAALPHSWQSKKVQTAIEWARTSLNAWKERQANKSLTMNKRQQEAYANAEKLAADDFKKLQDTLENLGLYEEVQYVGDKFGKTSIGKLVEQQVEVEENTKAYRDLDRAIRIRADFLEQQLMQRAGGEEDLQAPKQRGLEKTKIRTLAERRADTLKAARAAEINKPMPKDFYVFTDKELDATIKQFEKLFAKALEKDAANQKVKETGVGRIFSLSNKEYQQVQLVKDLRETKEARSKDTELSEFEEKRRKLHERFKFDINLQSLEDKRKELEAKFDENIKLLNYTQTNERKRLVINDENKRILDEVKEINDLIAASAVLRNRGQASEFIGAFKYKPTKKELKYARSAKGQAAGVTPSFYSDYLVERAADNELYSSFDSIPRLMDVLKKYGDLLDSADSTEEQKNRYQTKYDFTYDAIKSLLAKGKKAQLAAEIKAINKEVEDRKAVQERELELEAEGMGMSVEEYKRYLKDDVDYRTSARGAGLGKDEVDSVVKKLRLPKGVRVAVFATLPDRIKVIAARNGLTPAEIEGIRGGVMPDGSVFIVADSHDNITDLKKTIAHEITGHLGTEGVLGEAGMKALAKRASQTKGGVLGLADDLGVGDDARAAYMAAKNAGKSDEEANLAAFRELLAYTEEASVTKSFLAKANEYIKALIGAVRNALRKMGLDLDVSTSDVYKVLRQARQSYNNITSGAYSSEDTILFASKKPVFSKEAAPFATDDELIASQKTLGDKIRGFATGLWFRTQFVDRYAATLAALKKGVKEGRMDELEAMQIEYYLRMYDQRNYFVAEIASHGPITVNEITRADGKKEFVIETGDIDGNKGLKAIADVLSQSGMGSPEATREAFSKYMIAERAKQVGLNKLNIDGVYSQAQIDAWVAAGRKNAAFQEARELYREYNRGLLDFARKTGAITEARFKQLTTNPLTGSKDFDFVPFYRKMGNDVVLDLGEGDYVNMGNMKNQPDLKRLVGGDAPILDFYTSAIQNTTMLTDLALRNLATRAAGEALTQLGYAKKVGKGKMGPNIIRAKDAGNDVSYEIQSEDLGIPTELIVSGLEGVAATLPLYVRLMSMPADILRKFITLNPVYAVRQMMRDPLAATLLSGADMIPVVDSVKEITKMIQGKSKGERILQGKGLVGGQVLTGNSEDMNTILNQIVGGKTGWNRALAGLESLAIQGDASTRVVMYNSFRKQGLSDMEASLATLESMNFSKRGVSPTLFHLNKMIPFMNAQIQGLDVLYRALLSKENKMVKADQLKVRKKLLQRGALMAGFTIAYAIAMQDDEGYKNATEEERLGNWFVKVPGLDESIKVPIPFEIGFLFKALPEAATNLILGNTETKRAGEGLKKLAIMAIPGGGIPIPAGIKPLIEVSLNKSFFTGREIIGKDIEGLDPALRYRDNTTEVAKMFGALGVSPVLVDYLIRGYSGGLGVAITSLANPVLRSSAEAEKPAGKGYISSTTPFIGGLFQPKDSSGLLNAAFDSLEDAARAEKTFNALYEKGQIAEAKAYLNENLQRIQVGEMYYDLKSAIGDLSEAERAVRANRDMTPEQKREQLDLIRKQKIDIARYMLKASGS